MKRIVIVLLVLFLLVLPSTRVSIVSGCEHTEHEMAHADQGPQCECIPHAGYCYGGMWQLPTGVWQCKECGCYMWW